MNLCGYAIIIKEGNSFYLHKRGYVYGSSPTHIYRILEVENPKKELTKNKASNLTKLIKKNEENTKKNNLPKVNIRH